MSFIPNMLQEALSLAELGFSVIPLHTIANGKCTCQEEKSCKSPGKHPRISNWQAVATKDPERIKALWTQFHQANVGIVTGAPSDAFVLDIDIKQDMKGFDSLELLRKDTGPWPATLEAMSGSGGQHIYFRYPDCPLSNRVGILPGIDIRADGGFIVAPPSSHISGSLYKWRTQPSRELVAMAPEALVKRLLSASIKPEYKKDEPILEGNRNARLTSIAGSLRRQGWDEAIILETLLAVNASKCMPPLEESEVMQIAASVSKYEPSPLYTNENIIHASPLPGKAKRPNDMAAEIINSNQLLTDEFNNTYKYLNGVWRLLTKWELEHLCSKFDTAEHTSPSRCEQTAFYVKNYSRKNKVKWNDLKRGEVALINGVFDIFSGQLRLHRPEDYLEVVFPIKHDVNAVCPLFDDFIAQSIGNDPRKILAIEEFLGYLLMPEAPYKTALVCQGPPDTGKTVLQGIMIDLVGEDKVCQIALDKLHIPRSLAPIKGKALNVVSELTEDALLSEDGFKRLVSTGEPIQLDAKFQNPETYTPFCKHAVFTNELPHVRDRSGAIYSRLLIVSFNNVIPKGQQNPNLGEEFKRELPGILIRALTGLKRLIENGGRFTLPEGHTACIEELKRSSNPMNEILSDYFLQDPAGYTSMIDVREVIRGKIPHLKGYSNKRITALLKAAGVEIKETSRDGHKGTFLIGYNLTLDCYRWLQNSRHQTPITGCNDPIEESMN